MALRKDRFNSEDADKVAHMQFPCGKERILKSANKESSVNSDDERRQQLDASSEFENSSSNLNMKSELVSA